MTHFEKGARVRMFDRIGDKEITYTGRVVNYQVESDKYSIITDRGARIIRHSFQLTPIDEPAEAAAPEASSYRYLDKATPITTGLLDYFPAALAAVARVSKAGNDKHNAGQPLHWARDKSLDHVNSAGRHLLQRGTIDPETGEDHLASAVWRLLAELQLIEEAKGAPLARTPRERPSLASNGKTAQEAPGVAYPSFGADTPKVG